MAEFSELIKNFDKIRDFMRDFYIYGFKSRNDFDGKSARTYDNEKRRCESYLGENFKWSYSSKNKVSFVSADCGRISTNPLFSAWKSKSFTTNDIMLHFYILDSLNGIEKKAEDLTEEITKKSGKIFDLQTVRNKCNEYSDLGLLLKTKAGKAYKYKLFKNSFSLNSDLIDAIKFFENGTLGIIGNYILDNCDETNDLFVFKHHYIAHTLEDEIVISFLKAIHEKKKTMLNILSSKSKKASNIIVYPLKFLCSFLTGRRYVLTYLPSSKRFTSFRLDAIKSVKLLEEIENSDEIKEMLSRNFNKIWGVSFDSEIRSDNKFELILHIDERSEQHIINRVIKEGRGGELQKIEENTFVFTKYVFDANEAMPWIKTFIGRILSFKASPWLEKKLKSDIHRMAEIYEIGAEE